MSYYERGKKAKELLNINKNPFPVGTIEHSEWQRGFEDGVYKPLVVGEGEIINQVDIFADIDITPKDIRDD
jgi:hypothetical protein